MNESLIINNEVTYWNKEVSEQLQVGDSTLRKWCMELEENGYIFLRDDSNNRAFTDHDLIALRKFKDLVQHRQKTKKDAAISVVSMFNRQDERYGTSSVQPPNNNDETALSVQSMRSHLALIQDEKLEMILSQQEAMIELINQQKKFIDSVISERSERSERDHNITQLLNELLEQKKTQHQKSWWQVWK